MEFEPNDLLPGLLRHQMHPFLEALCAEPQIIVCKARATGLVEHISGSSSFKLGREPEEELPKASELNLDFEGKSSSEPGRNLRQQGSDCPGRMVGLALGLGW